MKKGLKAWDLVMLALGTVVGGSFFLGSAIPIRTSGPSVIIAYILGGFLVYLILLSLSEMTVAESLPGSFRSFAQKYFNPWAGFVVGWQYWTGMVLAMSSEAVAISVFLKQWFPNISIILVGSIIIAVTTLINLLGTDKLSKLESIMAAIKILSVLGFIAIAIGLISGVFFQKEVHLISPFSGTFFSGGFLGFAGSMLIVMFTYAGFEIIGLAASETQDPHKNVPKAINYTVLILAGMYTLSITLLLFMVPHENLTEDVSPFVAALSLQGINWASNIMNVILVVAILSTMFAAGFSIARMLNSLADDGYTPKWVKDNTDIPKKCIIFSGIAMLIAFLSSFVLPERVYVFLVSSGGYSLLFAYLIITITHKFFRTKQGCPPKGNCQLKGYPITSYIAIISLILIIFSMPFVEGQGLGLVAGLALTGLYSLCYFIFIKKA